MAFAARAGAFVPQEEGHLGAFPLKGQPCPPLAAPWGPPLPSCPWMRGAGAPQGGWGVLVLPRPQQGLGSPWPCSSTSICSWRKLLESKAQAGELSVLPWRPKCRNTDNFEAVWRIYTKKNPFFHMLSCSVVVISVGNPPLFSFLQLLCTRGREALFQILF